MFYAVIQRGLPLHQRIKPVFVSPDLDLAIKIAKTRTHERRRTEPGGGFAVVGTTKLDPEWPGYTAAMLPTLWSFV